MTEKELLKVIARAAKKRSTTLNVSGQDLKRLPSDISRLTSLTELEVWQNQLTDLPREISKLTNLTKLNLGANLLTALPLVVSKLGSLTVLSVWGNKLRVLPPEIARLTNLATLWLHSNQLTALPPEITKLTNLTTLNLADNQFTFLPDSIRELSKLTHFFLHGNPALGIPPEVLGPTWQDVEEGKKTPARPTDILAYYFRTQAGARPLNEAKLILVGRGEVGKTCIINRLVHGRFSRTNKTEGIQITSWAVTPGSERIRLNVWDFGGQEIMHATHQFFLTERSLYLLVLNGREGGEDLDAEYWLKLIACFGGDSPVIVVLNKIAQHPFDLNRRALQARYPQVRCFLKTDCEQDMGFRELHEAIDKAIGEMASVHDRFPKAWFAIKNKLAGMKESLNENYIGYDRYRALSRELGEKNESEQDRLAGFLHCLGIALNYKDDPRLRDTTVLSPHWVTNGIYRILNARELAASQGILRLSDLPKLLPAEDYPPEKHAFLLELMRKFKLCFAFPDDPPDRYLVPELLDKQEPELKGEFDPKACLNFEYHYGILPEGLLPGFIVRTHVLSRDQSRWRSGVVLTWEGCRALVKADTAEKKVVVRVHGGTADGRRRLLAVIRSDLERIHGEIPRLDVTAWVPVPDHPEVAFDYDELVVFENAGEREIKRRIGSELVTLSVSDLLNGIDVVPARARRPEPRRTREALKVFVSYSHKDDVFREELGIHLTLLQREEVISLWYDRRIPPGGDWGKEIDENLETADIILLLVSADFIASDYCYDIEVKRAMERHKAKQARVIPVIIRDCDWRSALFGKLKALPKDGKPVRLWPDPDTAWREVAEGIRSVAEALRRKKD